ncbi:Uncharacterized protein APZ42_031937 [Daphnia magna]|uniref:Uncharacterized protein n=1 Tax=Daphnia magna TaxID=35525 RepID=A0A164MEB8_9CRUS|nr:Uncharacterized protein APZ42_031937 [Daphnia magna]
MVRKNTHAHSSTFGRSFVSFSSFLDAIRIVLKRHPSHHKLLPCISSPFLS